MASSFKAMFLFLSTLVPSVLVSQDVHKDYQPAKISRIPKEFIQEYAYRFGQWGQNNSLESYKAIAEFVKFAREKVIYLNLLDSAKLLMHDDPVTVYLNGIKDEIISSNSHFANHECKIFTFRSLEPNAFNLGEGLILFSLGLLQTLDTKEQIASVIAHEMSHDILDHVFISNQRIYHELYDEGFHKTLRKAAKTGIGRRPAIRTLAEDFLNQHLAFRKSEELSADSLGYILFTNAGFKGSEFIHSLEKLDSVYWVRYSDTLQLERLFQFSDYPFNPHWLNPENAKSEGKRDLLIIEEEDAYETHPDYDLRIENIRRLSADLGIAINEDDAGSPAPEYILNAIAFESIGAAMLAQDYTVAMFISLHLLQEFPDNIYLKTLTAHCLVELYLSIRHNEYLDYVQFQDPDYPVSYNLLLAFLHNMTSSSLKEIFDAYMAQELESVNNSYTSFLEILGSSGEKLDYNDIYEFEQKYKDPYLSKVLKDKWIASQ